MPKARPTFTIDPDILARFKQLVPNMSEEIEVFMSRRIVELAGSVDGRVRYDELKKQYNKLVGQVSRKDDELKESPYYEQANQLFLSLGVKKDFSNADELIPKLTKEWKGPFEFLHEYISLVELARDKRVVERELTRLRSQSTASTSTEEPKPRREQSCVTQDTTVQRCTAIMPMQLEN